MSDHEQFLITVIFPSWSYKKEGGTEHRGEDRDEYGSFMVRYLVSVPVSVATWLEEEQEPLYIESADMMVTPEYWINKKIKEYFINRFESKIAKFTGKIYEVAPFKAVIL